MEQPLTLTATIALVGILPIAVVLFLLLPPRTAAAATYVVGWLFLPQAQIPVPGAIPDWDRVNAIAISVLAGVAVMDGSRLSRLRPSLLDLPVIAYCALIPLASSMSNGLGLYDGAAQALTVSFTIGLPYLVGRMYFSDPRGLRILAIAVFLAGLIYVPLCLWEVRMSPQIHRTVYGFHQHTFLQTYRFGGWRPMVFLQHGLAVGMLLTCAAIQGMWLWSCRRLDRWQTEGGVALVVLVLTAIFCKSLGAVMLLAAGTGALLAARHLGTRALLVALTVIPPAYITVRMSGSWAAEGLVDIIATNISADRAASVQYRLHNETLIVDKGWEQPLLGWGGWGRGKVEDESRGKTVVADGMWVIAFNRAGLAGLSALNLMFLLPVWCVLARAGPPRLWTADAQIAVGLAAMLALYAIDNLMNAMFSPWNPLAMGGLTGWLAWRRTLRARPTLRSQAVARWGPLEVKRREGIALSATLALEPELRAAYAPRFQALLLLLDPAQVEAFAAATPAAQRETVERWLGLRPAAEPAPAG